MIKVGLSVRLEARAGKEEELATFLAGALPLAEAEPQTVTWFALRSGPRSFTIVDTFVDEAGRQAHLAGRIAAALAELFMLADDSTETVVSYRDLGRLLVACDGGELIGHAQLVPVGSSGRLELKSLAVRPDRQGEGIGRMLVERAQAAGAAEGFTTLVVATAAADTGVLRFYQRLGFRLLRVERDVFTAENGYPPIDVDGIPLLDQVWLDLDLRSDD